MSEAQMYSLLVLGYAAIIYFVCVGIKNQVKRDFKYAYPFIETKTGLRVVSRVTDIIVTTETYKCYIKSCKTKEQIEIAYNLLEQFKKIYGTDNEYYQELFTEYIAVIDFITVDA